MPVAWITRLIGGPIKKRVSGSDIFDALRARERRGGPLRVFLFGGEEGVAAAAATALNATPTGLKCVGTFNIRISQNHDSATIGICGHAIGRHIGKAISRFRETLTRRKGAVVD
jgi:N-acetylglucosaminyldiphosphoundecaprenol N-acetyl-beta-D-mannosaminyltransferase